jgi:hypothetical protein
LGQETGASDFGPNPERGYDLQAPRALNWSQLQQQRNKPTAFVDVFVDNFCGMGQEHQMNSLRNQRRLLMHLVDRMFRPSDAQDSPYRKEPISRSKLAKQDATWQDVKQCLGWDYAGGSWQLMIANHLREKTQASLDEALSQQRVSLKKWQSLLGQLRSLVLGMPSAEGQFSLLQTALTRQKEGWV